LPLVAKGLHGKVPDKLAVIAGDQRLEANQGANQRRPMRFRQRQRSTPRP